MAVTGVAVGLDLVQFAGLDQRREHGPALGTGAVGNERGGKSAAITYALSETARLNGFDPQAWHMGPGTGL